MKTKTLNHINAEILSSKGFSIERTDKHWSIYNISGNNIYKNIRKTLYSLLNPCKQNKN
jgi:hypothetical protein